MKIEEYIESDGSSPYQAWFDSLDVGAAVKVNTAKTRMGRGLTSAIKWFDGIGEYVIDWGPGYRIYLAKDGEDLIILFGGGTKRGQSTDIAKAKELHQAYKDRKAAEKKKAEEEKKKNEKDKRKR